MRTITERRTLLNTSSVADIAFLMLVFFMVTTVMKDEKGLSVLLPIYENPTAPVNERNVFTIQINSENQYMVEGIRRESLAGLRDELKTFILNHNMDPNSSESPQKAVISLKTDRGTSYGTYIAALDEIQGAYYEIYAQQAGVTVERFRKLDLNKPADHIIYQKGRVGLPMNISIADPTRVNQ